MNKKIISFFKEFIYMTIGFTTVGFLIFKLFNKSFGIENIIGFMIGWSIVKVIEMLIEKKKAEKE